MLLFKHKQNNAFSFDGPLKLDGELLKQLEAMNKSGFERSYATTALQHVEMTGFAQM